MHGVAEQRRAHGAQGARRGHPRISRKDRKRSQRHSAAPGRGNTLRTAPDAGHGVSIVVPTYREAGNIKALVKRTSAAMAARAEPWELVISDDQSDDATVAEVARAGAGLPVRAVVRSTGPRELAANVLHGIGHTRYAVIVVMDADLSHRPEDIAKLIAAIEDGAQMAIGSRYLKDAEIDARWSTPRRWGSRVATAAARTLWAVSDPLSGFFALRRTVLDRCGVLDPVGYKIALEFGVRARLCPAQVPIRFDERHAGESKMDLREVVRFTRHLARLARVRHPRKTRVVSFGCVGLSGLVIDVGCYLALTAAGVEHRIARTASFWPAATWNWALNRQVTFADRARTDRRAQWARFVGASATGAVVNVGTYIAVTGASPWLDTHRLVALAMGVALGAAVNFCLASKWVFAGKREKTPAHGATSE